MSHSTQLFIDGEWTDAADGRTLPVLNPATGAVIGKVAHAGTEDLARAVAAADRGFRVWRNVPGFDRYRLLRQAADLLRTRVDDIARTITQEQGKPLSESLVETRGTVELIEWFAEEARRTYGRLVPARAANVQQAVVREPVGPVAAFSPWNAPLNTSVRKICGALAAGCSVILKAPEETPASCAALVRCFADCGLPPGVLNLVYGTPAEISEYLIPHPVIRKITFTGSTPVGKRLAALAGQHMKRITLELGGHAPAVIFDDADVAAAVKVLGFHKFRNCGQVCISPTRFLVQRGVYDQFVEGFAAAAAAVRVGDPLEQGVTMGPLANARRLGAIETLVADALSHGARLRAGGRRPGGEGFFFEPTVLTDVPLTARIMNEEPFGPVAPIVPFRYLRRDGARGEPAAVRTGCLRLYRIAEERRALQRCG
jgi:succinate-semialdehyde dehydrogenase / glutarate-semialdehyde dehydrogenase